MANSPDWIGVYHYLLSDVADLSKYSLKAICFSDIKSTFCYENQTTTDT